MNALVSVFLAALAGAPDEGSISVRLGDVRMTNLGLVAVARVPAFTDALGSTYGSASGLAATGWTYDLERGEHHGRIWTLPDRGRNDPTRRFFTRYVNRAHAFDAVLATGSLSLQPSGVVPLRDPEGRPCVGEDPGNEVRALLDRISPASDGSLSLDAEGLVVIPAGGFLVSDEYAPGMYRFDAAGILTGVMEVPEALTPRDAAGAPMFTSLAEPTTGRRPNQGIEGLGVTLDGRWLMAITQGAPAQDASDHASRRRARVMVYDLEASHAPIAHHILPLPTFRRGHDRRASGASDILPLGRASALVLARDDAGRGSGRGSSRQVCGVYLADFTTATNLVGTPYDGPTSAVVAGALEPGLREASLTRVIDLADPASIERFGLNADATGPDGDENTLSEKWEGLALAPDLSTADLDDAFLFVSNDNDFITRRGVMTDASGQAITYEDAIEIDTMILVYRVRIESP